MLPYHPLALAALLNIQSKSPTSSIPTSAAAMLEQHQSSQAMQPQITNIFNVKWKIIWFIVIGFNAGKENLPPKILKPFARFHHFRFSSNFVAKDSCISHILHHCWELPRRSLPTYLSYVNPCQPRWTLFYKCLDFNLWMFSCLVRQLHMRRYSLLLPLNNKLWWLIFCSVVAILFSRCHLLSNSFIKRVQLRVWCHQWQQIHHILRNNQLPAKTTRRL